MNRKSKKCVTVLDNRHTFIVIKISKMHLNVLYLYMNIFFNYINTYYN